MKQIQVRVKRMGDKVILPAYATNHSSGMDLRAHLETKICLEPGQRQLVPTGLSVEIPPGFEAQIRPRSGLAIKEGIGLCNSPGTIDADYRGEIKIILINWGQHSVIINPGDRIAQIVFQPVTQAVWEEVDDLQASDRGSGGFGSTGLV